MTNLGLMSWKGKSLLWVLERKFSTVEKHDDKSMLMQLIPERKVSAVGKHDDVAQFNSKR